jgi:cold-inducible RNA-binding protein
LLPYLTFSRGKYTIVEGATKLYVGNISFDTTKEDLHEYFGEYGEVKDAFIPQNKFGGSRGFGFISIKNEDVEALIEATNNVDFMGRTIAVNHPLPPGEKPAKRGELFCGSRLPCIPSKLLFISYLLSF